MGEGGHGEEWKEEKAEILSLERALKQRGKGDEMWKQLKQEDMDEVHEVKEDGMFVWLLQENRSKEEYDVEEVNENEFEECGDYEGSGEVEQEEVD